MKLEDVLGAELYAQVEAKINEINANQPDKTKHVRFADLSEGGYVSKSKYDDKVNGLTQQVTDLQGQITQRDTDLAGLNEQLSAAQADAGQLAEAQKQLSTLQSKYDKDSKAWAAKNARQAREYAIRSMANEQKFTSAAAKRDYIREAVADETVKLDGEVLIGYTEFAKRYQESDPDAFVVDTPPADPKPADPAPTIVLPGRSNPPAHKMSLSEAMKAKNENPNLKINFDA
ncbi:MAG: phage scaffolding protein [Eubacterium sp.]|nr:phage scaffolding protein [Eubacterium sp.]